MLTKVNLKHFVTFYFLVTTHQMATEQKGIIFNLKLKVIGVKRP